MRPSAALLTLLLLGLSLLTGWSTAAQAEAETERRFRDWLVRCTPEESCSASTAAVGMAAGAGQLRVSPSGTGAGYEIVLAAAGPAAAQDPVLVLRVDDEAPLRLALGGGYAAGAAGPVIASQETVQPLIRQMLAGGRLTVGFGGTAGEDGGPAQQVEFSLWGITAALDFMERRSGGPLSAAAAAPGDWSVQLADFLPAMRRCLVATPGGPALVNKAWPMNRGMVGVRTLGADGRRWDCVAEQIGQEIAMFEPVPGDAGRLPGEGAPLFTPPGQQPPEPSCYRHERARDAGGGFVGWLYYPGC